MSAVTVTKVQADDGQHYYMVRVDGRLVAALDTAEAWELLATLSNTMHDTDAERVRVVQERRA